MKLLSLAALLVATTNAVSLKADAQLDALPVPAELVQTTADVEVDAEIDAEIDAEAEAEADAEIGFLEPEYPEYPGHGCDCHDKPHDCAPPVLDGYPSVLQMPSPSTSALDNGPLCYCNNGKMHTEWEHNVSVDTQPCEHGCGKKPHHKKPHKKHDKGHPTKPH